MKKKTIIVSVLLGILLIGIVSASLLTYFGRITGSVEVKAPVIYFSNESIYEEVWFGDYNLIVNELSSNEIVIFEGGTRPTEFVTVSLGVNEFYHARFDITAYLKTNWDGEGQKPLLNFIIYKLNGHEITKICEVSKDIGATEIYYGYEMFCESVGTIDMSEMPKFGIALEGDEGIEYYLSVGDDSRSKGASRIEVTAT